MADLTYDIVRQLLKYEPETGKFYWLHRPREFCARDRDYVRWNARYAGTEAFTFTNRDGYRVGKILHREYNAHRIAWLLTHKAWPIGQVDHIDGNPANNRADNLRDVSIVENQRNAKRRSDNSSGITGVAWDKRAMKWRVQISVNCRVKTIGRFPTIEEAAAARATANVEHGFSKRHGV
jgi:hypothetical protein